MRAGRRRLGPGAERIGLSLTVVWSDGDVHYLGEVRQRGVGRHPRDPAINLLCHDCAEGTASGDVEQQTLERAPGRDGFIDRLRTGRSVRRQHRAKRRVIPDECVDTECPHRGDQLTEELHILAEACVRRVGRADEEVGEPAPLSHEELRVKVCEEGLAGVLRFFITPGKARRRVEHVDIQAFECVRPDGIELFAAGYEHGVRAALRPQETAQRTLADER